MCGRYELALTWRELRELYDLVERVFGELEPRYNIAPSQMAPVVRCAGEGGRELASLRWGLVPYWAKDEKIGFKTFNARAEGLSQKPSFREAYRARRCVVPASSFYEWERRGRVKQPYRFHRADGHALSLAGLWERWRSPGGEVVESFSIVTTPANAVVGELHERMPAILDARGLDVWLDPALREGPRLAGVLRPAPDDLLARHPVSRRMNRAEFDDPACARPVELDDA